MGFPIRTSADQRSLASPRGFSQRATSFIASWRQGIHRTLLSRSIHHQRPYAGPSPTFKHQQLNQNAQQFSLSIQPTNPIHLSNSTPPNPDPSRTTGRTAISLCSVVPRGSPPGLSPTATNLTWRRSGLNRRPPACKAGALPLSYAPRKLVPGRAAGQAPPQASRSPSHPLCIRRQKQRMGQGGLEPPTPRLSSVCSNQLSYWPSPQQATLRQPMPGPTQPANLHPHVGMRGRCPDRITPAPGINPHQIILVSVREPGDQTLHPHPQEQDQARQAFLSSDANKPA